MNRNWSAALTHIYDLLSEFQNLLNMLSRREVIKNHRNAPPSKIFIIYIQKLDIFPIGNIYYLLLYIKQLEY